MPRRTCTIQDIRTQKQTGKGRKKRNIILWILTIHVASNEHGDCTVYDKLLNSLRLSPKFERKLMWHSRVSESAYM